MTSRQQQKGDRAEREVAQLLSDELGLPVRRAFGAGRGLDEGDLVGLPRVSAQVANYTDLVRAIREKLPEAERQRLNARADFAALFARRYGGSYVVVQTVPSWCAMFRETL